MLEVNSSKTFDEVLVDDPNLYDGIAGYTWSADEDRWVNTGVSDVTKTLIEEWFGLRKVCDDDNFKRFFKRKMDIAALRYAQLSRIELSAFDPTVAYYMESETLAENSKTSAGKVDKNVSGTKSGTTESNTVRTPDLTEVIDRDTTGTHSKTDGGSDIREHDGSRNSAQGGTDVTTRNGSKENDDVKVQKNAPMSIEYAAATAGQIPNLNWGSMTGQGQGKNTESNNETENVQHGLTENGSDESTDTTRYGKTENGTESGTDDQTRKQTGNETTVVKGSSSGTTSSTEGTESSGTESGSGKTHEIKTGRFSMTPQEAFSTAVAYLKTSSAFEWLKGELEECFLSVYDI